MFRPLGWLFRVALLAVALSVSCATLVSPAWAESPAERKKAGAHFSRGKELFDEGDFQGALVEFERAYKLSPNWRVLFNIGQVKYQLQDYPGAMRALEQYLKEGGSEIPADRRTTVQSDIERLRSRVAYVKIDVNEDGASVLIDDRQVGTSPLTKAVAVSAGHRKITAMAPGAPPVIKFVDLAGGDSAQVSLEVVRQDAAPQPIPQPVPDPDTGGDGVDVPWAAWGVTAGLGVGTLVFGLLALDAASDFDDAKAQETSKDELDADRNRVLGFSITTDVFLAATVITAAISVYLTVDAATGDDEDAEVGLRLTPGSVALEGRF